MFLQISISNGYLNPLPGSEAPILPFLVRIYWQLQALRKNAPLSHPLYDTTLTSPLVQKKLKKFEENWKKLKENSVKTHENTVKKIKILKIQLKEIK